MPQRGTSFIAVYTTIDRATNAYITGDVGNQTIQYILDGVLSTPTNNPVEIANGRYAITLTANEMQAASIVVMGTSSTSGAIIIDAEFATEPNTVPETAPASARDVPPGGSLVQPFFTRNAAGAYVDADSPPTYTIYRNNAATALTATIGHAATGRYSITLVLGSPWVAGDTGYAEVNATVAGVPLSVNFLFNIVTPANTGFSGIAVAGGASSVTLDAGASSSDGLYNGQLIVINAGTASQQVRRAINYVSRVVTVDFPWVSPAPAAGTPYLFPGVNPQSTVVINPTANQVIVQPTP